MHIRHTERSLSLFISNQVWKERKRKDMERFMDKVAVVTGASSGIGRSITEELVKHGMKVVGLARRVDKVKMLAEELKSKPGKLFPLQVDLMNQNEISKALEWIEKNLGTVDVLVNNAAVEIHSTVLEGTMEAWEKTFDTNVIGLTFITKGVLKLMKKKGTDTGHIVNINDNWGHRVAIMNDQIDNAPYTASKFALNAITQNLRLELARLQSNIKVTSVSPGLVDTEMTMQTLKENPRLTLKPKDVAEAVIFTLQTPETVLVKEMVITSIREI